MFGDGETCPVLFETKRNDLHPRDSKLRANNARVMSLATEKITSLCASGTLNRVSVRGWASTLNSFAPPNEELARSRADVVVEALLRAIPDCAVQIHDDSEPGTRAVTERFGEYGANQCAQIQITSRSCN